MPAHSHRVFLALILVAVPASAQTAADIEQRIASLPAAEQAYERFRFWLTKLPPAAQASPNVMQIYREHLLQTGRFSADAADRQIKAVEEGGQRAEIQRWNRILTAEKPRFNTAPNAFLVEMASRRKAGTALDVGMGQGRNAIWLAQQGWDVTGFDPAEKAVALAQSTAASLGVRLKTEIRRAEDFDFGERRWDLILLSYSGGRGLAAKLERALRPGGILVIEGMHRDATKGRSIGAGVVFDTGELAALFPGLRAVRYEEPMARSDFGLEVVRLVRYCGERPAQEN
jgi:SAM-dependent methyltransferase